MTAGREATPNGDCQHGNCCEGYGYLLSIMQMLYKDGPEKIGQAEYVLLCSLLDEVGK